jgi:uncharacterized membrane protein
MGVTVEASPKMWYESKALWVNLIAALALIAQSYTKVWVLTPEAQLGVLALVNIFLRLVTRQPVVFR